MAFNLHLSDEPSNAFPAAGLQLQHIEPVSPAGFRFVLRWARGADDCLEARWTDGRD